MALLRKGDVITASTEIRATPAEVYRVVSDVTRFGEWSPETTRAEWTGPNQFRAWNRRGLGRWRTISHVAAADPDKEFRFLVQALGGDWTEWTYLIEPGVEPDTALLTESFRMCVALPFGAVVFEWLFLFVLDRPNDLRSNLQASVARIRHLVEAEAVSS